MTSTIAKPTTPTVRAATAATYAAFIGSGFAFASWASRIPQIRDRLELDSAALGLVLLAIAVGSLLALPLSGPVVTRIGSARTVMAMAILLGVGLTTAALGSLIGVVPVVIGLFLLGFANGAWDVAMNVQGTVVERHLDRSIMSRFHAGFSLGTVAGALVGAAMVALHVEVAVHLAAVAVLVVIPWCVRGAAVRPRPRRDRAGRGRTVGGRRCAGRLAGAAHPAHRSLRPHLRLRRRRRQRLDQRRLHRRPRRLARAGHARVRRLPHRHDGRSLVRSRTAGPVRPGPVVRTSR